MKAWMAAGALAALVTTGFAAAPASAATPPGSGPATITLQGTVRDFINQNNPPPTGSGALYNPDFENVIADDPGIVQAALGADGTPVYAHDDAGTATTHGPTDFNMWYHDTPNYNVAVPVAITLAQTAPGATTYSYDNQAFFPIDTAGWNDPKYGSPPVQLDCGGHNFSFTYQLHTTFTYEPGQQFTFAGDDDVFVFINKTQEIDLGGVHGTEQASFNLDDPSTLMNPLNLTVGQTYPFDLFFAERHTCGSDIAITTSIPLVASGPAKTALKANPYVVNVLPGATLYLAPSATLTSGGAPVKGEPIVFSADKQVICTAKTDATGVAKCSGTLPGALQAVLGLGYQAKFAGDANFAASSATGNLISVNNAKLL
jgi:fibro-slime domain-containing protein